MHPFEAFIADQMQRRFARLVGRGTTALYVALRALALRQGGVNDHCEIILNSAFQKIIQIVASLACSYAYNAVAS